MKDLIGFSGMLAIGMGKSHVPPNGESSRKGAGDGVVVFRRRGTGIVVMSRKRAIRRAKFFKTP